MSSVTPRRQRLERKEVEREFGGNSTCSETEQREIGREILLVLRSSSFFEPFASDARDVVSLSEPPLGEEEH